MVAANGHGPTDNLRRLRRTGGWIASKLASHGQAGSTIVTLALVLGCALAIAPAGCAATRADAATATPLGAVKSALDKAIKILGDQQMPIAQRRRELRQIAEGNLDLTRMAQAAMGVHWDQLSPAERTQYVPLFAAFIETAYLDQIQDYVKLRIEVSGEKLGGPRHALVFATVLQPDQPPIPITFVLENRGDHWLVYDVQVEDISMVENYRAQFDRVIREHGIKYLMSRLKQKQAQLEALLGQTTADSRH
jgi:phospholipid transport system substrate-binding protein